VIGFTSMPKRDRKRWGIRECRTAWMLGMSVREYRELEAGEQATWLTRFGRSHVSKSGSRARQSADDLSRPDTDTGGTLYLTPDRSTRTCVFMGLDFKAARSVVTASPGNGG
jgi:hypothetical protein